jgi:hypothetical protein
MEEEAHRKLNSADLTANATTTKFLNRTAPRAGET